MSHYVYRIQLYLLLVVIPIFFQLSVPLAFGQELDEVDVSSVDWAVDYMHGLVQYENSYFENYGVFPDLNKLRCLVTGLHEGFDFQIFHIDDGSDFIFTALPCENDALIGLMIDKRNIPLALINIEIVDDQDIWFGDVIDLVDKDFAENGNYNFIDIPELENQMSSIHLFISPGGTDIIIDGRYGVQESINGSVWLSGNRTGYAIQEFNPNILPTQDEYRKWRYFNEMGKLARGTLRSIGSSMIGYMLETDDSTYGTFYDLQSELWISQTITHWTMFPGHNMIWCLNSDEDGYVVAALPRFEHDALQPLMVDDTHVISKLIEAPDVSLPIEWVESVESGNPPEGIDPEEIYYADVVDGFIIKYVVESEGESTNYIYISETGLVYEYERIL